LLAGSLCEKAHIYIWDEPLNFIDVLSHRQIEDLISDSTMTILFVEHDVSFTDKIATKKICFS
jgi:lincosamide and streptogramin A transport system ATP-binding/permease protein